MNKQLLSFITKNQNKYAYIELINQSIHIQQLNNQSSLILTKQQLTLFTLPYTLTIIHQFNTQDKRCLDSFMFNDNILYLLQSTSNIIILIYNIITNAIEIYEKLCNTQFNNLKLIEVIDYQSMVYNAIMIKDNSIILVNQGLQQITFQQLNNFINPNVLHRVDRNSLILQTENDIYKVFSNLSVEPLDLPQLAQIQQVVLIANSIFILTQNQIIDLTENDYTIYPQNLQYQILGVTDMNQELYIYFYIEQNLIVQSIKGQNLMQIYFPYKIQKLHILSQYSFFVIDENNELFLLFKPDYNSILQKYYKIEEITEQKMVPQKNKQILKPNQDNLFNLNKASISKQNLDEMITISLKYSFAKLLLLICSRIRVYKEFFSLVRKMSDNGNEKDIKELLDLKQIKKCECIENDQIMEEFIQEALQNNQHKTFIYFQKFFIENPQYINPKQYGEILDCPINRAWYEQSQLEIPQISNYAFKRQVNYISFLQKAKSCFIQDLFVQKDKQLQVVKQGMIGNYLQCFECLKPINTQSRNPNETKIIKYQECFHSIHKQCWNQQHECNYEKNQKKLLI